MTWKAKFYLTAVILAGASLLVYELPQFQTGNRTRFLIFFLVTLGTAGMKVKLPGVNSSFSVNFLLALAAVAQLSLPEVLAAGMPAMIVQSYWRAQQRPKWFQVAFGVGNTSLAYSAAFALFHAAWLESPDVGLAGRLTVAAMVQFLTNTGGVAIIVGLTENKSPRRVWKDHYFWCFPYYLMGAALVAGMTYASRWLGWFTVLTILPIAQVVYHAFRGYFGRLEDEKKHAEQMAALHLRTIQALALAIEAKDRTTHDHLQRVQVYAVETARELGLKGEQLEALQAAAVLHDIGKLAVPEHIISKPGKLTPGEFEKMKVHPIVGAEILERVNFPYPVAPIVRSHHEKWNGTGYPDGLQGEAIPIGSRILAAVDYLDALASDRQYRRALPLDEVIRMVSSESGKAFDPEVVTILVRRYREFEQKARNTRIVHELGKLSTEIRVERGEAPDAGFESPAQSCRGPASSADPSSAVASAWQEAQALYELAASVGGSLPLNDTLSFLAARVQQLVPHDTFAVYLAEKTVLKPIYVSGDDSGLFRSLSIPLGEGVAGWVAESRKPILNGNPSVEPGYLKNPGVFSRLNSALAVPIEGPERVLGVLALYHSGRDAYSWDDLRVLQIFSGKLGPELEKAFVEGSRGMAAAASPMDLPDARSLFVRLGSEIARCARDAGTLAVMVCDIDGLQRVNDRHGRLAGQEITRRAGAQLRQTCRGSDYLARVRSDEFVLVMPNLMPSVAEQRMADFERIVRQAGVAVCGESSVGLNCGCVFFPRDGASAEDLLAEAGRRASRKELGQNAARDDKARMLYLDGGSCRTTADALRGVAQPG